jgi:hypothetical protein
VPCIQDRRIASIQDDQDKYRFMVFKIKNPYLTSVPWIMIDRSCLIVPGTCPAVQHYRMGITVPKFTGALDVCLEHIITCFAYVHLYAYLGKKPTKHRCLYHIYMLGKKMLTSSHWIAWTFFQIHRKGGWESW